VRTTKINKVEAKPIRLHRKSEINIHRIKKRNKPSITMKQLRLRRRPSIRHLKVPVDVIRRYKGSLYRSAKSDKYNCSDGKINKKLSGHNLREPRRKSIQKSSDTANAMKSDIRNQHYSTTAQTIGMIGASVASEQIEGGEELRDSVAIAGLALTAFTRASSKGRDLYRNKSKEQRLAMKLKRVDPGNRVRSKMSSSTDKKVIRMAGSNYTKESRVKSKAWSSLRGASADSVVTGARGISRRTSVGKDALKDIGKVNGKTTSKAIGKAAGHSFNRSAIKNNTRSRLLNYFMNKSKQSDNGDNIGALLKDLIMMRMSVVVKHIAGYIGGLLLNLVLLIAITCLPVMLVIAVIYNSPLAIFFPPLEEGDTVMSVTSTYIQDFNREVTTLAHEHAGYDGGSISYTGSMTDNYYDIMVVYMVKYGVGDTASVMNDTTREKLKGVFDDMCSFRTSVSSETVENEDGTTTNYSIYNTIMELKKDMEYLLVELQKEWESSGKTSATVVFQIEEVHEVNRNLQQDIADRQELLKHEEMTFEQSIQLTKQNYILLRLIKRYYAKSRGQI
jgi:uncharacterized protein YqeY